MRNHVQTYLRGFLNVLLVACSSVTSPAVPSVVVTPTPPLSLTPNATVTLTAPILEADYPLKAPSAPPADPPACYQTAGVESASPPEKAEKIREYRYLALLELARQESEYFAGTTNESVYAQLGRWAKDAGIEVKDKWSGKYADEYQAIVWMEEKVDDGGWQL